MIARLDGSPDVLELQEIDKPVAADDEPLVRVHAASLNILDWYGINGLAIGRMAGKAGLSPST